MAVHVNSPTAVIAASTTSARAAYPAVTAYVRVFNEGTTTAFLRSGDVSVVATSTTGQALGGGKSTVFFHDQNDTHLAVILASGTGNIYFSPVGVDELVGF